MEQNIFDYLTVGEATARAAGQILLDYWDHIHVQEKGRADLVTEADFASQEKVKEMLLNGEFMQASMIAPLYKFFSGM